jgi:hypothetical protein
MKNVFTGIGQGPNSQLTYLMNKFTVLGQGSAAFRRSFGTMVSLDHRDNGFIASNGWAAIETPLKSWWWSSNTSGYPYLANYSRDCKDSADNRNPGKATKITEFAVNYSPVTWNAAYSTTGTSATDNVFRWTADTTECEGGGGKGIFTEAIPTPVTETREISISPNPATQVLNVAWYGDGEKTQLLVIDLQGRIVYQQQIIAAKGSNVCKLNISMLAKGEYLLRLSTGRKVTTYTFLKK